MDSDAVDTPEDKAEADHASQPTKWAHLASAKSDKPKPSPQAPMVKQLNVWVCIASDTYEEEGKYEDSEGREREV